MFAWHDGTSCQNSAFIHPWQQCQQRRRAAAATWQRSHVTINPLLCLPNCVKRRREQVEEWGRQPRWQEEMRERIRPVGRNKAQGVGEGGKKCEEYYKDRHQWETEGLKEADTERKRPEVLLQDERKKKGEKQSTNPTRQTRTKRWWKKKEVKGRQVNTDTFNHPGLRSCNKLPNCGCQNLWMNNEGGWTGRGGRVEGSTPTVIISDPRSQQSSSHSALSGETHRGTEFSPPATACFWNRVMPAWWQNTGSRSENKNTGICLCKELRIYFNISKQSSWQSFQASWMNWNNQTATSRVGHQRCF